MEDNVDQLIRWAEKQVHKSYRWAILYWTLHNWFVVFSWVISICVTFGIARLVFLKPQESNDWNVWLLIASSIGLIIQILDSALRLREKAQRGRRITAELQMALLNYLAGTISKKEFLKKIKFFLDEEWQEDGP